MTERQRPTFAPRQPDNEIEPVWSPTLRDSGAHTTDGLRIAAAEVSSSAESKILEILRRAPSGGPTLIDNQRRERELQIAFSELTKLENFALRKRLAASLPSDPIVLALARLVPERRARLMGYLERTARHARAS